MKNLLLVLILLISSQHSKSQKSEYSYQIGSGFFSYQGGGASKSTYEYHTQFNGNGIGNPYGKKSGFSIFCGFEFKRVNKSNFFYGAQLNYEILTAKNSVDTIVTSYFSYTKTSSNSTAYYRNNMIVLNPFFGKRLYYKKLIIDLNFGIDVGLLLNNNLSVKNNENGQGGEFYKNMKPNVDYRVRGGASIIYKRFGLELQYSKGIKNLYKSSFDEQKATSSFLRYTVKYLIRN